MNLSVPVCKYTSKFFVPINHLGFVDDVDHFFANKILNCEIFSGVTLARRMHKKIIINIV